MEQKKNLYNGLKAKYGKKNQIIKAIEEMSELTKELCKFVEITTDEKEVQRRLTKIAEEIADTEIMLEQLKQFLMLNSAVERFKVEKLIRIEYLINTP